MAQITWTNEAFRWLEDIFEHIAADNPDAASRTVEGIFERAQVLAQYPEMPNIALERAVRHVGRHPGCQGLLACSVRQAASWPAAQLGR
jgi:plasmid stabilization system protein ParE